MASIVGRAYVTVRAITAQLDRDIESAVDSSIAKAEAKINSAIGASLGENIGNSISEGVDKSHLSENIDETIKRGVTRTDHGDVLGQAIGDSLGFGDGRRRIDGAFDRLGLRIRAWADSEGTQTGLKILDGIGGALVGGGGAIVSVLANKFVLLGTGIVGALGPAIQIVGSLLGSTVALVAALGPPLAAALAVGAGGMFGLVTTIGSVIAALKVTSPLLTEFKSDMSGVGDQLKSLAVDVQQGLLPALDTAAHSLVNSLGPVLAANLTNTGRVLGGITLQFAQLAQTPLFQARLNTVLSANNIALGNLGDAGIHLADALAGIVSAAAPLIVQFSQWADGAAAAVDQSIKLGQATGGLGDFFDKAGRKASQIGDIFSSTFGGLSHIFSQAIPFGDQLLNRIDALANRFQAFTSSTAGKNAIASYFERANEVTHAFLGLVGSIFDEVVKIGVGGGGLVTLLNHLQAIVPVAGQVVSSVAAVGQALIGAITPAVATVIAQIAPNFREAGETIASTLGPALEKLAPQVGDLINNLLKLLQVLSPILTAIGDIATPILTIVNPALSVLIHLLDLIPNSILGVIGAVALLRVGFVKLTESANFEKLGASFSGMGETLRNTSARSVEAIGGLIFAFQGLSGPAGAGSAANLAIGGALLGFAAGGPLGAAIGAGVGGLAALTKGFLADSQSAQDAAASHTVFRTSLSETQSTIQQLQTQIDSYTASIENAGIKTKVVQGVGDIFGGQDDFDKRKTALQEQIILQNDLSSSLSNINDVFINLGQQGAPSAQQFADAQKALADANFDVSGSLSPKQFEEAQKIVQRYFESQGNGIGTVDEFAGALGRMGSQASTASEQVSDLQSSIDKLLDPALNADKASIAWHQSLADLVKTLKANAVTLDENTQAGRDNRSAIIANIEAIKNKIKADSDAHASQQQLAADLSIGRQRLLDAAGAAGFNTDKVKALIRQYGLTPKLVKTSLEVAGLDSSLSGVTSLTKMLIALEARKFVTELQVSLNTIASVIPGGSTKKKGNAGGGWISGPGTSTSDSIPFDSNNNVSNQEFLVNAADAKRNARLVEMINSGASAQAIAAVANAQVTQGANKSARPNIALELTVNNPVAERTSGSIQRVLAEVAQLGIFDGGGSFANG